MVGGPVFYLEMLLGGRRSRYHIFRYVYGGWLLLQFGVLYLVYLITANLDKDPYATADFAGNYVRLFLAQQFILLLLATPALAAGAVTDEKERGTLQYLFSAGLGSFEIVWAKLWARLFIVGQIFLAGLPLLCFMAVFGGLSGWLLLAVWVQTAVIGFAVAAASLLASVWARQTRDAVLGLYAVAGVLLAAAWGLDALGYVGAGNPVGAFLEVISPTYVFEAEVKVAGDLGRRLLLNVAWWVGIGLVCLGVSAARLRTAYLRQLEGAGKRKQALIWFARPPVGEEPLRWKERFVIGLAPLPWLRYVPRWLGLGFSLIASLLTVLWLTARAGDLKHLGNVLRGDFGELGTLLANLGPDQAADDMALVSGFVIFIASLLVGIRCSGAITGEREKGTWEALLLTPLETRQLVRAKLWGVVGATYPYLIVYAVPLLLFSLAAGVRATITFLVGAGVTWLAMFYVGSAGLWCSARAKGSWRSLLGLFGWAYVGGFLLYVTLSPLLFAIWFALSLAVMVVEMALTGRQPTGGPFVGYGVFFYATSILMAVCFLLGSWFFLREAEKRVADYERTRHWRKNPPFSWR
jgi:ABC-type transport system involved in multi-copper enzyme maturation permease subunit